jgi:hypothetical protein
VLLFGLTPALCDAPRDPALAVAEGAGKPAFTPAGRAGNRCRWVRRGRLAPFRLGNRPGWPVAGCPPVAFVNTAFPA